jgi:hypothetical protein
MWDSREAVDAASEGEEGDCGVEGGGLGVSWIT